MALAEKQGDIPLNLPLPDCSGTQVYWPGHSPGGASLVLEEIPTLHQLLHTRQIYSSYWTLSGFPTACSFVYAKESVVLAGGGLVTMGKINRFSGDSSFPLTA